MTTQDEKQAYPASTDVLDGSERKIYEGSASGGAPPKPLKVYGTLDDVLRAAVKEKPSATK